MYMYVYIFVLAFRASASFPGYENLNAIEMDVDELPYTLLDHVILAEA